jgi:hypothetical protein
MSRRWKGSDMLNVYAYWQNNVIPEGFRLVPALFLIQERDTRQFKSDIKTTLLEMYNGVTAYNTAKWSAFVLMLWSSQVLLQYGVC